MIKLTKHYTLPIAVAISVLMIFIILVNRSLQLAPTVDELVAIGSGLSWLSFTQSFQIVRLPAVDAMAAAMIAGHSSYHNIISNIFLHDLPQYYPIVNNVIGRTQLMQTFYNIGYDHIFLNDLPQQHIILLARMPTILASCLAIIVAFSILYDAKDQFKDPYGGVALCRSGVMPITHILCAHVIFIYILIISLSYQPIISANAPILLSVLSAWLIIPRWLIPNPPTNHYGIFLDIAFGICSGFFFLLSGVVGFILLMTSIAGLIIINDMTLGKRSSGYSWNRLKRVSIVICITFLVTWAGYKFDLAKPVDIPLLSSFSQSEAQIIPLADPWKMLLNSVLLRGNDDLMCFLGGEQVDCGEWHSRFLPIICQIPIVILISLLVLIAFLILDSSFNYCCFDLRPFHVARCPSGVVSLFVPFGHSLLSRYLGLNLIVLVGFLATLFYHNDQELMIYEALVFQYHFLVAISLGTLYVFIGVAFGHKMLSTTLCYCFIIISITSLISANKEFLGSVNLLSPIMRIWHDGFDRGQYMLALREVKVAQPMATKSMALYYNVSAIKQDKLWFSINRSRDDVIMSKDFCKQIYNPLTNSSYRPSDGSITSNIFTYICQEMIERGYNTGNSIAKTSIPPYDFLNLYQMNIADSCLYQKE